MASELASPSASVSASALLKILNFWVKVFKCLYLLNLWMDLVDTLPDVNFKLKFLVKVFGSLYLLKL